MKKMTCKQLGGACDKVLLQTKPEYLQTIPLQYLASYIGVTQRHLSRLRKEVSF